MSYFDQMFREIYFYLNITDKFHTELDKTRSDIIQYNLDLLNFNLIIM